MSEMHAEGPVERAEAPGRSSGSAPGSSGRTAWALLAGPTTAVTLGALLALQLFGAAFVPDDLAAADLPRSAGFGRAEILRGLGLVDPTGSWLFWLLVLLVTLHLAARGLSGPDGASDPGGPSSGSAPGSGGRRGGFAAATLTGLGLAALLAGLIEGRRLGLDADLTVRLDGAAGPSSGSAPGSSGTLGEVAIGPGLRVKRVLPFSLACTAPDPRDQSFVLPCTLTTAAGTSTLQLVPGEVVAVEDLSLSLREARVAAGDGGQRAGFLWWQDGTPQRLTLTPGTAVRAASDATRTFEAGVSAAEPAPWLRVAETRADGSSGLSLLWPARAVAPSSGAVGPDLRRAPHPVRPDEPGAEPDGRTAGTRFEALLPQEVTLRVAQRPWAARALLGLGFALAAAGLLLAAAHDRKLAEETA
jgi:hypothetical protein